MSYGTGGLPIKETDRITAWRSLSEDDRISMMIKKINELVDAVNVLIKANNRLYDIQQMVNADLKEGIPIEEVRKHIREERLEETKRGVITVQELGNLIEKEVLSHMNNVPDNEEGRNIIMQKIRSLIGRMKLDGCKIPEYHINMEGNGTYIVKVQVKEYGKA